MFCKNCGAQLADGTVFCAKCGAKQDAAAQPAQQPAPQYVPQPDPQYVPQPDPQYIPQSDPQPAKKKVNGKLIAIIAVAVVVVAALVVGAIMFLGGGTSSDAKEPMTAIGNALANLMDAEGFDFTIKTDDMSVEGSLLIDWEEEDITLYSEMTDNWGEEEAILYKGYTISGGDGEYWGDKIPKDELAMVFDIAEQVRNVVGSDFSLMNILDEAKQSEEFDWDDLMDEMEDETDGMLTEKDLEDLCDSVDGALRDEDWLADTLDTYKRETKDGKTTFTLQVKSGKFVKNVAELIRPIIGETVEDETGEDWDDLIDELGDQMDSMKPSLKLVLTTEDGKLVSANLSGSVGGRSISVKIEIENYGEPSLDEKLLEKAYKAVK